MRELLFLVLVDDGDVRRDDALEALLRELDNRLGIAVIEVVEENAAKTTGLLAVLDHEIFISPLLVLGVELRVVLVTRCLVSAVEMLHILCHTNDGSCPCGPPGGNGGCAMEALGYRGVQSEASAMSVCLRASPER